MYNQTKRLLESLADEIAEWDFDTPENLVQWWNDSTSNDDCPWFDPSYYDTLIKMVQERLPKKVQIRRTDNTFTVFSYHGKFSFDKLNPEYTGTLDDCKKYVARMKK